MKWTPIIFIFLCSKSFSQQTVDTLTNAKAYRTNFVWGNTYGVGTNGHVYGIAFTLNYNDNNNGLPVTMYRIDLTTKSTFTTTLPNTVSAPYMFWRFAFDSSGTLYTGFNSNRDVWRFRLKDSINYKNYGNSSQSGVGLAYSILLGRDKNIYIGNSSSPSSTDWAMVDVQNDTMLLHPEPDPNNGYGMSIMGDTNWIAYMTGQSTYNMWAVRKSDNYKKLLASQQTLMNTGVRRGGNYFQTNTGQWYKVTDTTTTPVSINTVLSTPDITYREVNVDFVSQVGLPLITNAFFDPIASKQYWKLNNVADSVAITSTYTQTISRRIFADRVDTNKVYYVGDYYGNFYQYNTATNVSTALGFIGFNIFSALQYDDTTWYIAGYPSAQLAKWTTTQAWTAETFADGQVRHLSTTTNPQLIGYWRTYCGVHEPQKIIMLPNGVIAMGGDVIRQDNTTSIAFYNTNNGEMWGVPADSIVGLGYVDICAYGTNRVIFSTNGNNGGTPKLFIYNTDTKQFENKLDFGFNSYGHLYVTGDLLYAISGNRFYKVNLSTKELVYNKPYSGTINQSQMMVDGKVGINTSGGFALPPDFLPFYIKPNSEPWIYDWNYGYYYFYNNQGLRYQILQKDNVSGAVINLNTLEGIRTMLNNLLR